MRMLDQIFGIHERALQLRGERVSVLAANLANADTPNYKARDLDFAAVLGEQSSTQSSSLGLTTTSARHLAVQSGSVGGADLKYRMPFQPSLDGNTVEVPLEQAAFAENAVRYQASLMFINRRIASIESALTGN
jgi:flagellar basal-body rod protein FlgB